jgi:Tfp pilus assembly protein PilX
MPPASGRGANERGSAILVVLMLMLALAAIVVANTQTLRLLKEEIRFVDQMQQQKYDPAAGR